MKRIDCIILFAVLLLCSIPFIHPSSLDTFELFNQTHGYLLSFIKFAVLATFGECIALRIVKGRYWEPGFGLAAKALMWGFLGLFLKACFIIFAVGTPQVLPSLGVHISSEPTFGQRLLVAFTTSVMLNTVFAPIFMILHKILDDHIKVNHGKLSALMTPINVRTRLEGIEWEVMWGFVLKKTIPLFWIPAQTITFMLPEDLRILFAAFLGAVLGVILALANLSGKQGHEAPAAA